MFKLIFIFLLLFFSVWFGVKLAEEPGYLLISYKSWTFETTLLVGIFLTLVSFFVLYIGVWFIKLLFNIKQNLIKWKNTRASNKAMKETYRGFLAFSEGNWKYAEKHFMKGMVKNNYPSINYLLAAQALSRQGNYVKSDNYLKMAEKVDPEIKNTISLIKAKIYIKRKHYEEALAILDDVKSVNPLCCFYIRIFL